MALANVKERIFDVLKQGYFNGASDLVDISDGPDGDVHVVVVSRKLDGKRMKETHDLIWDSLTQNLSPDEWGQVSLTIGVSPEQVKAY